MRVGGLVCCVLALVACGAQPAPSLGELSPKIVCGTGRLPVSLSGDHYLARAVRTLAGDSALEVPRVSLSADGAATVDPDVTWVSPQLLSLVVPLDQLSAGSYALQLSDPDGQQARLEAALTRVEVPPVKIQSLAPQPLCLADGDRMLQLGGSGFVVGAEVTVRDDKGATVLSPTATVSAGQVTVALPAGSLPPGGYTLVVQNPVEAGCAATAAAAFTLDAPPRLTAAQQNSVCADGGRVTVSGSGLESGATVELRDGAMTLDAVDVRVTMNGRGATITFGNNNLPKNSNADLVWHNPDGCSVTLSGAIHVNPGRGSCNN